MAELVQRVGEAVDRYRAGEIDAFEVDQVIFRYGRAAKELWKFCNLGRPETVAWMLENERERGEAIDWWAAGEPWRR